MPSRPPPQWKMPGPNTMERDTGVILLSSVGERKEGGREEGGREGAREGGRREGGREGEKGGRKGGTVWLNHTQCRRHSETALSWISNP